MKGLYLLLVSQTGDELDTITVEDFVISDEAQDYHYNAYDADNQEILERVSALYNSLLALLSEYQAAPSRGLTWLKLALGEALLTADQQDGDVVLPIIVQPLKEG